MHDIRTERLHWREPRASDVDGYMAFVSDYEVVKWTSNWPHPGNREFTASRCVPMDPDRGFVGPVFLGDEQIGGIGLVAGALGYFFARKHWRRGYGTEIGSAIIARAFRDYDLDQIKAEVMVGNPGSDRVLQKLGFKHAGKTRCSSVARGGEFDAKKFVLSRADWLDTNPYELRTDRLKIRGLIDDDWRDLQRLGGVPHVARMMTSIKAPWAAADVKAWLDSSKWRGRAGFRAAITLLDGTLIGGCGFNGNSRGGDIAYFLGQEHWNKGYATEAMAAFLADVFARFAPETIHARHFADNPASGNVLNKLGFVKYGTDTGVSAARLEPSRETLYRLSRNDFEARP